MKRTWGLLTVGVLLLVTACSGEPAQSAPPPPSTTVPAVSTTTSKVTSTTPTTPPPPASPAKVTAACPFLPLVEVQQIMGTAEFGQKGGQQEAAVKKEDGITKYACQYNGVVGLYLHVLPEKGWSVPSMSAEAKKECVTPPTMLPGIGETAWYCENKDDFESLLVYKRGHGQIRIALFSTIGKTRPDVYPTIAERLGERL
ncbi:hypothetical protein [Amycolatopsis sp. lyj-108]|uniref:hypothetical protein n=1 Tax=Amycolatopsis sp. lyj-108 TaxID=2789286 RepID=UPI00397DE93C